jgi:diadenylate cyclase
VKGLLILVAAWVISSQLHLKILNSLLNNFFQFTVLALLVVFQPELRRALEQIGRTNIGKYWGNISSQGKTNESYLMQVENCINVVSNACAMLSSNKTGALIVFERETKLGEIVDTGTLINATPSEQMIGNIFFNKAPLHDGAMVIRDGKILAAGCILPLTSNDRLSADLGTRHRAAVGVSEVSDAVIVIVSEETGTISMAKDAVITRNYSVESLKKTLLANLIKEENDEVNNNSLLSSFRRTGKNEK